MYDNTIEVKPEVTMIWQILRRRKLATEDQLQEVLEESRNTGQDFEEVLYNYQIITEDQLLQLVADELNTQFVELHISSIDKEVANAISADIARTYSIVPIQEDGETLTLATDKPFDTKLIDELHFVVSKDCRIVVRRRMVRIQKAGRMSPIPSTS